MDLSTTLGFLIISTLLIYMLGGPKGIWVSLMFRYGKIGYKRGTLDIVNALERADGYERHLSPREMFYYKYFLQKAGVDIEAIKEGISICIIQRNHLDTKLRIIHGFIINIEFGSKLEVPRGKINYGLPYWEYDLIRYMHEKGTWKHSTDLDQQANQYKSW